MGFDPLGIPLQWAGQKLGYDIRTIGGVAFYGGPHADFEEQMENFRKNEGFGKAIMGGASFGSWFYFPLGTVAHAGI